VNAPSDYKQKPLGSVTGIVDTDKILGKRKQKSEAGEKYDMPPTFYNICGKKEKEKQ
jgi:hypothetical protein